MSDTTPETPPGEKTIDEIAQERLYQATQIYQEQIVPLLMGINPTTDLSKTAFALAHERKLRIDRDWDAYMLPFMRKLDAHNKAVREAAQTPEEPPAEGDPASEEEPEPQP